MKRATVLAYHAVGHCPDENDPQGLFVSPEDFARQMEFLAERRTVVPLTDIVADRLPEGHPAVAVTFDDAYRNILTNAAPVLRSFSFPATVFVPTAYIGAANSWDHTSGCDLSIMSTDELIEAARTGLDIQSHGHAHMDMTRASTEACRTDLQSSIDVLRSILGRPPRYLAWPYSHGSQEAERAAREAGFEATFSIDRRHEIGFSLGRVPVAASDGERLFAVKTSGFYLALRHSAAGSLVFRALRGAVRRAAAFDRRRSAR